MNPEHLLSAISIQWDAEIVPQLAEYIRIPAKSPHFDPQWEINGHIERAIRLAEAWVGKQPVRGLTFEIVRLPGRTPLLYFDVAGTGGRSVLLYGHLDKQPEMVGWREGFGPWDPLLENGKLYGRGSADDGYAVFAALAAIGALQAQGIAHSRCIGMIETCEESGSYDLPAYLDALAPRMGKVDFVVGLDSGCGDYERLWATTSLRGLAGGRLTVEVLTEGVHSGDASGIVPSPSGATSQCEPAQPCPPGLYLQRWRSQSLAPGLHLFGTLHPEDRPAKIAAVRTNLCHPRTCETANRRRFPCWRPSLSCLY